jgi:hypothetical protein
MNVVITSDIIVYIMSFKETIKNIQDADNRKKLMLSKK